MKFRTKNSRMCERMSESGSGGCDETDDEQLFVAWRGARPGLGGGGVSAGVGMKECNDDVEVLSCVQNGLTQIRFD